MICLSVETRGVSLMYNCQLLGSYAGFISAGRVRDCQGLSAMGGDSWCCQGPCARGMAGGGRGAEEQGEVLLSFSTVEGCPTLSFCGFQVEMQRCH